MKNAFSLLPACLLCATSLMTATAHAGDFDRYEELQALIASLERDGTYAPGELATLFASVNRQDKVLEAIARPAEKTKEWKQYRPPFLSDERIRKGVEFWNTYENELALAQQKFGVPPEMIIGILGVETRYGASKGGFRVVDALASLAFDYPPRAAYFRKELRTFLQLAKEQGLNPLTTTGSYAGAMGYPQFMPSSWRNLAIDFNEDGKIDLLNDPVDAIGSIANYFRANGWREGEPVAVRARITADNYDEALSTDLKTASTLGELAQRGLAPREGGLTDDMPASAIRLQGENGAEFWLAFNNFYVISKYNRSTLYSMAAYQLGEAIRNARQLPPAS